MIDGIYHKRVRCDICGREVQWKSFKRLPYTWHNVVVGAHYDCCQYCFAKIVKDIDSIRQTEQDKEVDA